MKPFLAALLLAVAASPGYAQPADVSPSFEVASVRRSGVLDGGRFGMYPGGRFMMVNGTVESLISYAYNVRLADFIVGAPEWVRSERYDVNAKAADPTTSLDQLRLMIRTLLRERFNLRVTHSQEVRPAYTLVIDRADGRLGASLQKSAIDCDVLRSELAAEKRQPTSPADGVAPCTTLGRPTSMTSGGTTMAALAASLTYMVGRPVTDRTGLKGYFTYHLDYEPSDALSERATSTLPSIFTALQEQLGLRLESARAPVDVLVINRVERPTPD